MSKITFDKARIDAYINLLERGDITFAEVHRRMKEPVRKELKKRGLGHLAH